MYVEREKPPEVFDKAGVIAVVATYAGIIGLAWCVRVFAHETKEEIIPIDMTIVMNENLDGEENEPPPEAPPQPAPEPPKPVPPKQPSPPEPQPPPKIQDALISERPPKKEKKKEIKKEAEKKPQEKKPDAKELRRQRLEEMRKSVKKSNSPPPKNNGRTEKAPPDLAKLLNDPAFKAGARNQGLDASESQRCSALIKNAFYAKWNPPVKTSNMGEMWLEVRFSADGRVAGYKLVKSSGDASADKSVLEAAAKVHRVAGLSAMFLEQNAFGAIVKFTVK